MREQKIEQKLVEMVKTRGGRALKLTCPGFSGMPDRMILTPKGKIFFVEVKAPGQKPRALQAARHKWLTDWGFKVYVLDSIDGVEPLVEEVMR